MIGDLTREGLEATAATALCAALSFWLLPPTSAVFATLLAPLMIYVAVYDLRYMIIPDWTVVAIAILGLTFVGTLTEPGITPWAFLDGLLRMTLAGVALLVLRLLYRLRVGSEGLGLGDVKLAAAGASFLHWDLLPFVLAAAALGCALAIGTRMLVRRTSFDRHTEIPFGAFLAPAIWFGFVLGQSRWLGLA